MRKMPRKLFSLLALFVLVAVGLLATPGRVQAAVIQVTTTNDENGSGSGCSLREAIISANYGTAFGGCSAGSPGGNTIFLSSNAQYRITLGELLITSPVTITGTGMGSTHVIGVGSRVFHIKAGSAAVTLSGFEIQSGSATGLGGAGIYNESGTLYLRNVLLNGNSGTSGTAGGAIFNDNGATLFIITSTLYANQAVTGAAIYNTPAGTMNMWYSLVLGNSSPGTSGSGGGIYNDGTATIVNSTFSSNKATRGDGISNNGTMTIIHSTIADNGSPTAGQGIYLYALSKLTITNTIVARNITNCQRDPNNPSNQFSDKADLVNPKDSLDPSISCTWINSNLNQDPKLPALDTSNLSPANTYAIGAGSAAIDAANMANCQPFDQRLYGRPGANTKCDIGAFEKDGTHNAIYLPEVDR